MRKAKMEWLGRHYVAEMTGCDSNILKDKERVEKLMKRAAELSGAAVVKSLFHTFNPYGVSGVVIISESHLTIHTWPEFRYAAVDFFTCSESIKIEVAFNYIADELMAENCIVKELKRGFKI